MPLGKSLPSIVFVAVLAVAVTATGLVAFWPAETQQSAPEPIGQNASERLAELDGYVATVESSYAFGNESNRSVQRVWARPSTGERRVESIEGPTDSLVVSNDSVTWLYDREENNVTRLNTSGQPSASLTQAERIEQIFTRLNVTRDTDGQSTTVEVKPRAAPLPVVPSGESGVSTPAPPVEAADEFGVRYEGTDTVAGREVYVISIRPTATADNATTLEEYKQTMHVDAEWFLPLETHIEWVSDDRRIESTTTYRNVTFEPGIDDDTFRFEPPENATIVDPGLPSVQTYDSVAELRANTELPIPDPDIDQSYELERAQLAPGEYRFASLRYTNETSVLTVSVDNMTTTNVSGEPVTVDGREVVYRQFGTTNSVVFECGDFGYSISGNAVSKDTLLEIVASIDCR
ncbi:hypothetical protein [Salinibaculum salinum]|uniref:LolA family protein n=1 Tax=Salinibaculum salinum TaxID=3131996 RepID=UPI0030ED8601